MDCSVLENPPTSDEDQPCPALAGPREGTTKSLDMRRTLESNAVPPLQVGAVKQNQRGEVHASGTEVPPPDILIWSPGGIPGNPTWGTQTLASPRYRCQGDRISGGVLLPRPPSSTLLRGYCNVALPGQRPHQAGLSPGGAWFTCTSVSGGHSVLTNRS